MSKNNIYKYYVEGEGEKRIIDVLKTDFKSIKPGKVEVFNVNQEHFSDMRLRTLKNNTIVVLVYDVDVDKEGIENLEWNIRFLKSRSNVKSVICIPQVENLEDELIAACDIKEIKEITKSKSNTNYKSDLLNCSNLYSRLQQSGFDYGKFWKKMPKNSYGKYGNDSEKISN